VRRQEHPAAAAAAAAAAACHIDICWQAVYEHLTEACAGVLRQEHPVGEVQNRNGMAVAGYASAWETTAGTRYDRETCDETEVTGGQRAAHFEMC
jgi:hypothetical protein